MHVFVKSGSFSTTNLKINLNKNTKYVFSSNSTSLKQCSVTNEITVSQFVLLLFLQTM